MVVYSYNELSYSFVGCINNRTSRSPSSLMLAKKYIPVDGTATIFVGGEMIGTVSKIGDVM